MVKSGSYLVPYLSLPPINPTTLSGQFTLAKPFIDPAYANWASFQATQTVRPHGRICIFMLCPTTAFRTARAAPMCSARDNPRSHGPSSVTEAIPNCQPAVAKVVIRRRHALFHWCGRCLMKTTLLSPPPAPGAQCSPKPLHGSVRNSMYLDGHTASRAEACHHFL